MIDLIRAAFGAAPVARAALDVATSRAPAELPHRVAVESERRADSFINTKTGIGTSGDRITFGRPDTGRAELESEAVRALYRYNGYGRRIVELPAREATRRGWTVDDGTDQVNPFRDDDRRLDVRGTFREALTAARRDGGAVVWMVTDDVQIGDFRALEKPLRKGARVLALQVFERAEATVVEWDGDPASPTYRGPMIWHLTPITPSAGIVTGSRVHASRVIYVDGAPVDRHTRLSRSGFGDSVLEACYDAIRDKSSHDRGGAILSSELHVNVLKIANLANLSVSDQASVLASRMKALAQSVAMLNMVLVGKDEEYTTRAANVTGYADLDDAAKSALATASGIHRAILFGDAPGGLGDSGALPRDLFAKLAADEQETRLRGPLTKFYAVMYNARGGVDLPPSWEVKFHPLDEPTRKELAEIEKIDAETDAIRIADQVYTADHVAASRFSRKGYGPILPVDPLDAQRKADEQAERDAVAAVELAQGAQDEG